MKILITGSSSGLGLELVRALGSYHDVVEFDIKDGNDVTSPDKDAIDKLCGGRLDVLINNAGVNGIDWLEDADPDDWDRIMDVNAKGIFLMSQACLGMLKESRGAIVNIVSNAATTPMRCSAAYNASKGAAKILTAQLARELTPKYGISVFSVSPNKLAGTEMSDGIDKRVVETRGWTPEEAHDYQVAGFLNKCETPSHLFADFVSLLATSRIHWKFLSGSDFRYGN